MVAITNAELCHQPGAITAPESSVIVAQPPPAPARRANALVVDSDVKKVQHPTGGVRFWRQAAARSAGPSRRRSRPPPSVAQHDRSANSREFGVMAMISSFGPPRFAGWTAAILLSSATAAFADSADLLQRFNHALQPRSLAEVS